MAETFQTSHPLKDKHILTTSADRAVPNNVLKENQLCHLRANLLLSGKELSTESTSPLVHHKAEQSVEKHFPVAKSTPCPQGLPPPSDGRRAADPSAHSLRTPRCGREQDEDQVRKSKMEAKTDLSSS